MLVLKLFVKFGKFLWKSQFWKGWKIFMYQFRPHNTELAIPKFFHCLNQETVLVITVLFLTPFDLADLQSTFSNRHSVFPFLSPSHALLYCFGWGFLPVATCLLTRLIWRKESTEIRLLANTKSDQTGGSSFLSEDAEHCFESLPSYFLSRPFFLQFRFWFFLFSSSLLTEVDSAAPRVIGFPGPATPSPPLPLGYTALITCSSSSNTLNKSLLTFWRSPCEHKGFSGCLPSRRNHRFA